MEENVPKTHSLFLTPLIVTNNLYCVLQDDIVGRRKYFLKRKRHCVVWQEAKTVWETVGNVYGSDGFHERQLINRCESSAETEGQICDDYWLTNS